MKKLLDYIQERFLEIEKLMGEIEAEVMKEVPVLLEEQNRVFERDRQDKMPFCIFCGYQVLEEDFDNKIERCRECEQRFEYK